MQFKTIIISSLLFGLFIFSAYAFISSFAYNNEVSNPLDSMSIIGKSVGNMTTYLNESSTQADEQRKALQEETGHPTITLIGFVFNSILNAGSVFMVMGINIVTMPLTLLVSFGISPIVVGVISAIIIIALVLGAWRLFRAGE